MKSQKERPPALTLHSLGQKLPDISGCQIFHREQLRDLHVSASARSPSRCFPHLFPERFLLVFPSAAVAEEVFPCLGRRPTSTAAPPAFIVASVSESFQVRSYWRMPALQSVELGCQGLHTIHWDESLTPSFAFQSVAIMFATFVGLPLSLRCRLCF
jgi:hypothetical protein